jgi:hypothetical protein
MQSKRTPATQVRNRQRNTREDMRAAVKKLARSYRDMKNTCLYPK